MDYLVSIIIPVYKVESDIERCLTSVVCQTYHDSAIECILVDDCSPDKSMVIAQDIIDGYRGNIDFKIIINDTNCGLSVARNNGLKHASGKYILFLDSDDYLKENCLQILIDALKTHPDAEVVMGNCFNQKQNSPHISFNDNKRVMLDNTKLLKAYYIGDIPMNVWNSIVSRELISRYHLTFVPNLIHEDIIWTSVLYTYVNKFIYIPEITMVYTYNPSSITNGIGKIANKDLPHRIIIMEKLLNSFNEAHPVEYTYFLTLFLLFMLDMARQCSPTQQAKVKSFRSQLLRYNIHKGRFSPLLFVMWTYNPLYQLFRFKFFRNNIIRIRKATYLLVSLFNH